MATRDRTLVFEKIRSEAKNKSLRRRHLASVANGAAEGRSLMSDAQTTAWEEARTTLPPQYVDTVEIVNEDVRKIREKS